MAYHWIITNDHLDGEDTGVNGPGDSTHDWYVHPTTPTLVFRMYDDDGELYYTGRYVGNDGEDMFAPLDEFGMPNAGCTRIDYKNETTGDWETL